MRGDLGGGVSRRGWENLGGRGSEKLGETGSGSEGGKGTEKAA